MKIKIYILFVCILIHSSCSNNLDVLDPADPVPVVTFVMNPADTIFNLTLTRSFSGEGSGYDLAQDASRVFYQGANITLEAWSGEYKVWETPFQPSDRVKDPGIFPEVPGYCFKSDHKFLFNQIYTSFRLVVDLPGMPTPAFSRIPVLPIPEVPFRYEHEVALYPDGFKFGPPDDNPIAMKLVKYRQLLCEFHYQEYTGKWEDRSVTFSLRKDYIIPGGNILYPDMFFNKIAANIKPVNDTMVRQFVSFDLIFLSGDTYFRDYIDTYENAGNMDMPPKGNISNAYGMFAMVTKARFTDMLFDRESLDSLKFGYRTRRLGFVKW